MSIRALVADDHPVVRAGLVALLDASADIEVVGTAASGEEAIALAAQLAPDVVLMDLRMGGIDGDEATALILAGSATPPRVIILTTYENDDAILRAISAGASGYLLKAAPEEELLAGIRSVAAGEVALAPSVSRLLVERAAAPARPPTPELSPRELEVLRLVAQGLSNRAIGARLYVGEATVKTHLLHVFAKLNVDDRTRAVTRAMELKLL
ncbi:MAG: response regulator transcription factor [Pseudolysinimonas sp.]